MLNDSVSKFFPEFKNIHIKTLDGEDKGETNTEVTILHCLTHTSGFGCERVVALSKDERETIDGTIRRFLSEGLEFEPFTREAYSGYAAFDILPSILKKQYLKHWDK